MRRAEARRAERQELAAKHAPRPFVRLPEGEARPTANPLSQSGADARDSEKGPSSGPDKQPDRGR